MRRFLAGILTWCLLSTVVYAQTQTHRTVPSSSSALSTWQNYLIGEMADRWTDQGWTPGVKSGGIHGAKSGLTSDAFATVGVSSDGGYVNQSAAAITYNGTLGCSATDIAWVVATNSTTGAVGGNFVRVTGTRYAVDCVSTTRPSLPSASLWLMSVSLVSGNIDHVEDLRQQYWFRVADEVANTHGSTTPSEEMAYREGDTNVAHVIAGCLPATSGTTTTGTFACKAKVMDSAGRLIYVNQLTRTVGPLSAGAGVYWIAMTTGVDAGSAGWTTEQGTHYLWQKSASKPANPTNGLIVAQVTISGGGAVTLPAIAAPRRPVTLAATIGWYDIRDYGAVCDGSTDDYPAIRSTADVVEALPGAGVIYIPPTSLGCIMNSTLTITAAGVTIAGGSNVASQLIKTTAGHMIVIGNGASAGPGRYTTVKHLNLQFSGATGDAIHGDYAYNVSITENNISFTGSGTGIYLDHTIDGIVQHNIIGMSHANTVVGGVNMPVGIWNLSSNAMMYQANRIDGNNTGGVGNGTGLINGAGQAVSMLNNTAETLRTGILVAGGRGTFMANNYFENISGASAVPIDLTLGTKYSVMVLDNMFAPGNGNTDADIVCTTGVTNGMVAMGNHHVSTHTSGAPIRVDALCDSPHITTLDFADGSGLAGTLAANGFVHAKGRLLFGSGDATGMPTTGGISVGSIKWRGTPTPVSAGVMTFNSGSANPGQINGYLPGFLADGTPMWVPYTLNPTP